MESFPELGGHGQAPAMAMAEAARRGSADDFASRHPHRLLAHGVEGLVARYLQAHEASMRAGILLGKQRLPPAELALVDVNQGLQPRL